MKHTPGPWMAVTQHTEDRGASYGVAAETPGLWIIPPLRIKQEDALLIAAAPELLSVLDRCVGYLADLNGSEWIKGDDPGSKDMRQRAKALQGIAYEAVKKAQGIDK